MNALVNAFERVHVVHGANSSSCGRSRKRLNLRITNGGTHVRALCRRAEVKGSAHWFRDTFACDRVAKGNGIYEVAQMLADTVETVQKHYAPVCSGRASRSRATIAR